MVFKKSRRKRRRRGGKRTRRIKRRRNKKGGNVDIKTKDFEVRKVELSHSSDQTLKAYEIMDLYYKPIDSRGVHKNIDVYNAIFDFANKKMSKLSDLHDSAHTRYYAEAMTQDILIREKRGSHIMITPTIDFSDTYSKNGREGKKDYSPFFIGLEKGTGGQGDVDGYAYVGNPIAINLKNYLQKLVKNSNENKGLKWICCPVGVPGHSVCVLIYIRGPRVYELYWADPNGIAQFGSVFGQRCNHVKLLFKNACDSVDNLTFKHDLLCVLTPQGGTALSYFHSGGFCGGYTWMLIFMIIINPTIQPEILYKYVKHRVDEWKKMGISSSSSVAAPKPVATKRAASKPGPAKATTGEVGCYVCPDDIFHPDQDHRGENKTKLVMEHRMKLATQCNLKYANTDKEHCSRKGYNEKGVGVEGQDSVCKWGPRPPCALGILQSGGDGKYKKYIEQLIAVAPNSIKELKVGDHKFKDWGTVKGRDAIVVESDWKQFCYMLGDEIGWNKDKVTSEEISKFRDKMIDITKEDTPLNWFEAHIIMYLIFVKEYIREKLYGIATNESSDILDNKAWRNNIPERKHNAITGISDKIKNALKPDGDFYKKCGITAKEYEDSLNYALM